MSPKELLEAEIRRCPYHDFLGVQSVDADLEDGRAIVRLPHRPELTVGEAGACFHGGVLASLVDIAAHAVVAMRIGQVAPTIDIRVDYLAPARSGDLLATAELLACGRSVARADVVVRDSSGRLVALGRGTFSTM